MINRALRAIALTVFVPVLMSFIVYYGFSTGYTKQVFNERGFREQYEHDVFKYRVLGRVLFLQTYDLLASKNPAATALRQHLPNLPPSIKVLDSKANRSFYAAYFLYNTMFLVLAAVIIYFLLVRGDLRDAGSMSATHVLAISLTALSQYVITPYDIPGLFFLLLSILLIVRPFRLRLPLLLAVQALSTLTRESAALAIPFYFAYFHREILSRKTRELVDLIALAGTFLVTYGLIRLWLGAYHSVYMVWTYPYNLRHLDCILGMLLMVVIAYLLSESSHDRRASALFLMASSPYIIAAFLIGVTWEIRLWLPVWLPLMVLARAAPQPGCSTRAGVGGTTPARDGDRVEASGYMATGSICGYSRLLI